MKKTKYSRRSAFLIAALSLAIVWFDSSMKNDSSYKMEGEYSVRSVIETPVDKRSTATEKGRAGVTDVTVAFRRNNGKVRKNRKNYKESFIYVSAVFGFGSYN
ncbi:MAG: hypothetical protein JNM88_14795 [Chitinophagaceae bacterium]|nr:hypothetical protein [Chitinophagaceae bacterium]